MRKLVKSTFHNFQKSFYVTLLVLKITQIVTKNAFNSIQQNQDCLDSKFGMSMGLGTIKPLVMSNFENL